MASGYYIVWHRTVTKVGWLLAPQKPVKRPGWWKGKFALFWIPAMGSWGRLLSKGWLSPCHPHDTQWARTFIDRGRGLHAKTTQSALTDILNLVIGSLTSLILTVLSSVSFSSKVCLFQFSGGQSSEMWQLMGFPGRSVCKESICQAGDAGLSPRLGRSPGKGNSNLLPIFLPGKSHGLRSLGGYSSRGHKSRS